MSETDASGLERFLELFALGLVEIAIIVIIVLVASHFVRRHYAGKSGLATRMQVIQAVITLIGLVIILSVIPIDNERRGQLLSLLGILLSAAIALSSTTVLGNAMAGLMLRSVKGFKPGDYVHVGEHFGRITEMDLFHVEIQTESSDLTTLSNVYMITHPFRVRRSSGTIISVDVSLGYDVPRRRVRELLLEAAARAELDEPFVQVGELGDFSVSYRIAGLLTDSSRLIAARSRLREMTLDSLHEGGVEIVSPSFMNQRVLALEKRLLPPSEARREPEPEPDSAPDAVVFDKASAAASVEAERTEHRELLEEIESLEGRFKTAPLDDAEPLRERIDDLKAKAETIERAVETREQELKKPG